MIRAIFIAAVIHAIFLWSAALFAAPLLPRGPSFSDSEQITHMSSAWQEKKIVHPADVQADILINLDQSTYPVLVEPIRQYAAEHHLSIHIHSGTCGITNRGLLKKEIDMGSFCCPVGKEDRFPGVIYHTLGITPLEIIVNPQNPLSNVSFLEAQQLFSGDIDRWSQLTSSNVDYSYSVQPVAFIHCKKRPGHWRLLLDNEDLFSPRLQNVLMIPDIVSSVATNKTAVSIAVSYLAHEVNKEQGEVKGLTIDHIKATDLGALALGRYPLYRVTSITYWQESSHVEEVKALNAYLDRYLELNGKRLLVIPASRLRQTGWHFKGEELTGEPPTM